MAMDDIARGVARQSAPWKEGQSWWVVGLEALIALVVGIYIVADPVRASDAIRYLLALILLAVSLGKIVDGFRFQGQTVATWATLRGGVGATAALITLLSGWSAFIPPDGARQILAVGLLAYGIIGLISLGFTFRTPGSKIEAVIVDILTIVLGLLLLTADSGDTGGAQLLGVAVIAGGIALLLYTVMLWSSRRKAV
jgi:uncharacterized membrane protein HdeD (DUF308 family)